MKKPSLKPTTTAAPANGLTRRHFIQIAGIGVAAPTFLEACSDDGEEVVLQNGVAFFPQSVASGDPRPDGVILWTRVDDTDAGSGLRLTLDIATDEGFFNIVGSQTVVATAEHDHVIKLRVSGLGPGTVYYYRFIYERTAEERYTSRTGRTRTAPAEDADVTVRFAVTSCQDFIGRYYNAYAKLAQLGDVDFVVHLGDYVYETTGDPNFQAEAGERIVAFTDTDGAIAFEDADGKVTHYAAQSLDNYRELYKTYRSDPWLQRVHEQAPFVCTWDDHEFSDDCWKDSATYFDGKVDETGETDRRKNAEQAHFEFMPTERGLSADGKAFEIGEKVPIVDPGTVLYRDFRFGKNLHLVLTDTRTYRPDHAIAEDAFYGTMVLSEAELQAEGIDTEELDADMNPVWAAYVDIDDAAFATQKAAAITAAAAAYEDAGLASADAQAKAEAVITGDVSVDAINNLVPMAIDPAGLPKGMSIDQLRFQPYKLFANDGIHARYLVHEANYRLWRKVKYAADPTTQDVMTPAQEEWLKSTLADSTATWKIVGSSISFTAMVIDVRATSFPPSLEGLPDTQLIKDGAALFAGFFKAPYFFNVDQWDGFPDKQAELLDAMRAIENVVIISGDIHSSYVTDHGKGTAGAFNVHELTGTGISSEPFKGFARGKVDAIVPNASANENVAAVIAHLEGFIQAANPSIVHASNDTQGFITVDVAASKLTATYWAAPEDHVFEDHEGDLEGAVAPFEARTFAISGNELTEES
jgi:alkaline phosphatase D